MLVILYELERRVSGLNEEVREENAVSDDGSGFTYSLWTGGAGGNGAGAGFRK